MANYIYGKNTVKSYLESNGKVKVLYLFNKGNFNDLVQLAKAKQVRVEFIDKNRLDKMASGVHQGVILEIEDYTYYQLDDLLTDNKHQLIVLCDQLEDPHNLGAILRSCDAAGVDGVIVGKHRSVGLNATVAKVSTGAINTVKVVEATNMVDTIKTLKNHGYWVIAAENDVKAVDYTEFNVDMPIVLVVGSEGSGISRLVKKECDILTTIPMNGSVNSLNVSVATGILLFDIIRRRRAL
ncbi:MAG: 23S rRNA (guanosine(2251)-2'-O)-methyltransferase RlmB [Erysipelothrix sp.]|nr:23S rRNA (guanosine(2251)-2'-O)-methyltransferase RlmB [Erysipelothrix sp.]